MRKSSSPIPLVLAFVFAASYSFDVAAQVPAQQVPAHQAPAAQPAAQPAESAVANVRQLVRQGDLAKSRQAVEEYRRTSAPAAQTAQVSLAYGTELLRASRAGKGRDAALEKEARRAFTSVIQSAPPVQQVVARSNLAVIDLEEGDEAAALRVFEEGYATAKALPDRSVQGKYLFNYARVLERAPPQSVRDPKAVYREAFLADPRLREAAEAGFQLSMKERNYAKAAEFASLLVSSGHHAQAEMHLRKALGETEVRRSGGSGALLLSLMDLIGLRAPSAVDFREQWSSWLEGLQGLDAGGETMRKLVSLGYEANIPLFRDERDALAALGLQGTARPSVQRVAAYFTRVGKARAALGDAHAAHALYSIGWLLDDVNLDAAIGKANLLLERSEQIDPQGRLLDQFVGQLFRGKGEAYLGQDQPAILRFHTVLGTIYHRQKRWGSSHDPQGALFQLEHAIAAHRKILESGRDAPVPGLYSMLAECYEAMNRPREAYGAYQSAAREALAAGNAQWALNLVTGRMSRIQGYVPDEKQVTLSEQIRKEATALQDQG